MDSAQDPAEMFWLGFDIGTITSYDHLLDRDNSQEQKLLSDTGRELFSTWHQANLADLIIIESEILTGIRRHRTMPIFASEHNERAQRVLQNIQSQLNEIRRPH